MTVSPPLHVGYIVREFPRLSETFILNEILELERQGVTVTVFSIKRPPDEPRHAMFNQLKADIIYLKDSEPRSWFGARGSFRALASALRGRGEDAKAILRGASVARAAVARGVTTLHAHYAALPATVAMHAARTSGLLFSFTAHAFDIFQAQVDYNKFRAKIDAARFMVTVSEYNRAFIIDAMKPAAPEKIAVIYNGIDLDYWRRGDAARDVPPVILSIGRLVPKKGFADLIDACAQLRKRELAFRCVIVGDGPLKVELENRINTAGLGRQVELYGPADLETIRGLMHRATILCLPCVRDRDGNQDALPTVLLEAKAAGLPIVSTTLSGIPEIVSDGEDGLLVSPGDIDGLTAAIARLLTDSDLHGGFAVTGCQRAAERFDLAKNVARLRERFSG
ncbi:MAG TPA: glycosyltransferase family 4 protein [candidate division Zixibacteria bacterium]|nr:glycosyltransferase family 4 protein [candidate division Zixibacteria bacterium]